MVPAILRAFFLGDYMAIGLFVIPLFFFFPLFSFSKKYNTFVPYFQLGCIVSFSY